ncbi:MAG: threonine synthase [Candidatus Micrarchaeota archaeon]
MFICTECSQHYKTFRYSCDCGGVLIYTGADRYKWKPKEHLQGVWRYQSMLPVAKSVSIGEGFTPLVKRRDTPHKNIWMKLEGDNPTNSFKDRGSTVVVSHARNEGRRMIGVASTGNMGASVAAYAAYGNLKAKVFVPADTPSEKLSQIKAYGPELVKVNGNFNDCVEKLKHESINKGVYMAETGLNPYYIEGEKTIAFEIYEQFGNKVPDKIVVPLGTGGLTTAIFKGFAELKRLGITKKLPQMIGVQEKGCSPIADAWKAGTYLIKPVEKPTGIASAILVKTPFNGKSALQAIKLSKGKVISISTEEIKQAVHTLGKEGVFAEPAAATTAAALPYIDFSNDEKVVLIVTGSGLKQPVV